MQARPSKRYTVADIAERCGAKCVDTPGLADRSISRIATLVEADENSITWIVSSKYAERLSNSRAAAVLGTADLVGDHSAGLIVDDADVAIATVLEMFFERPTSPTVGIHPAAVVDPTARLGERVAVGAHAVVGPYCEIGDGTTIHEGVSLGARVRIGRDSVLYDRVIIYDDCEIGDRVILHAGVIIGCDGFGYIFRNGAHRKLMHIGTVIIEDDVEIGANSCVDRGKLGPTRIGRGTKIDNLVQIAHNVQLGPLCIVVAQSGFAGSTTTGAGVVVGGQAGLKEGLTIGDKAQIAARSGVMNDVEAGTTVLGSPARPIVTAFREIAAVHELPQLLKRVTLLEKRVKKLDGAADD